MRQLTIQEWTTMVLLTCTLLKLTTVTTTEQTDTQPTITGPTTGLIDKNTEESQTFPSVDANLDGDDEFGKSESRKYKHEQTEIELDITTKDSRVATSYGIQETEVDRARRRQSESEDAFNYEVKMPEGNHKLLWHTIGSYRFPTKLTETGNSTNTSTGALEKTYPTTVLQLLLGNLQPRNVGNSNASSFSKKRCTSEFLRYGIVDGSCKDVEDAFKKMHMALPVKYVNGIRNVIFGKQIHSVREVTVENAKTLNVTRAFMEWGRFLYEDIVGSVQNVEFNRINQCCQNESENSMSGFQIGTNCIHSATIEKRNCTLDWRKQTNEATSFINGSTIYGSDVNASSLSRTFKDGKLQLPDKPSETTRIHLVWIRFHNILAEELSKLNHNWDDEKVYQEARRIIGALVQHVTYREFLPVVLGPESMQTFGIALLEKGYFQNYDSKVNTSVTNAFLAGIVGLGSTIEEQFQENDNFFAKEQKHILQALPPYAFWRNQCNLFPIENWKDLSRATSQQAFEKLRQMYNHLDDINLLAGGLAEVPVPGGLIGPTFACIIARQFLNLRIGDRFWYENGNFPWSFTPDQLQRIRKVSFAEVLCKTTTDLKSIQPYAFLPDGLNNAPLNCWDPVLNNLDLTVWIEPVKTKHKRSLDVEERKTKKRNKTTTTCRPPRTTRRAKKPTGRRTKPTRRSGTRKTTTTTRRPLKIKITNITTHTTDLHDNYDKIPIRRPPPRPNYRPTYSTYHDNRPADDMTYLFGVVQSTTPISRPKPIEVNIKVQYFPPEQSNYVTDKPYQQQFYGHTTRRPTKYPYNHDLDDYEASNTHYRPQYLHERPSYSDDLYVYRPTTDNDRPNRRPAQDPYYDSPYDNFQVYSRPYQVYNRPKDFSQSDYDSRDDFKPTPQVQKLTKDRPVFKDKLPENFLYQGDRNFVKVSSVRGNVTDSSRKSEIEFSSVNFRENNEEVIDRNDFLADLSPFEAR